MTTFGVTFVVTSSRELEELELLFSDLFDGLISRSDNRLLITIYEDGTCSHAVAKSLALRLESALGVHIISVDQDLVDIPEIARRTSRTRQNIQQLATGARGSNDFPVPLGAPGGKRIWDWSSVNEWFRSHQHVVDDEIWLSRADVAIVNAWLIERKSVSLIGVYPGGSKLDENTAVWMVYSRARSANAAEKESFSAAKMRSATIDLGIVAR